MLKMMNFGIFLFMNCLMLIILSLNFMFNKLSYTYEWMIFNYNSLKFSMIFHFDSLTLSFLMLVTLISSMVLFYSMKYMNLDKLNLKRFFYLLMLFILSMYMMIMSPNTLTIILGWDGLGLTSFCLIVYYQNSKAMSSGMLTMILNRMGDASLLMLIGFMSMFGSWNLILYKADKFMMLMFVLIAFTKSAQMPFSLWLPAAMMAPTPISSLVHSSTLVTAGVYIMIRHIDVIPDQIKMKLMLISSFTMVMSGLYANYEIDLKKIVALSTLSQLGFMFSILFLNMKDLTFFHLYIHAMFKSLMFMCVGSYIHYNFASQDLRDYKGMINIYPMKSLIFMFTSLSLTGYPFLLGFFSKDLIMEEFFNNKLMLLNMMNLLLGSIFTVSYSFRLYLLIMFDKSIKYKYNMIIEDKLMNLIMYKLMFMSMIYGYYYYMMMFSLNNINLDIKMKLMLIKMFIIGILFGYLNYSNYKFSNNKMNLMMKNMNYLNKFYNLTYINSFYIIWNYEDIIEKKIFNLIFNEYLNLMKMLMLNLNYKISIFKLMLSYLIIMIFIYFFMIFYL